MLGRADRSSTTDHLPCRSAIPVLPGIHGGVMWAMIGGSVTQPERIADAGFAFCPRFVGDPRGAGG